MYHLRMAERANSSSPQEALGINKTYVLTKDGYRGIVPCFFFFLLPRILARVRLATHSGLPWTCNELLVPAYSLLSSPLSMISISLLSSSDWPDTFFCIKRAAPTALISNCISYFICRFIQDFICKFIP